MSPLTQDVLFIMHVMTADFRSLSTASVTWDRRSPKRMSSDDGPKVISVHYRRLFNTGIEVAKQLAKTKIADRAKRAGQWTKPTTRGAWGLHVQSAGPIAGTFWPDLFRRPHVDALIRRGLVEEILLLFHAPLQDRTEPDTPQPLLDFYPQNMECEAIRLTSLGLQAGKRVNILRRLALPKGSTS